MITITTTFNDGLIKAEVNGNRGICARCTRASRYFREAEAVSDALNIAGIKLNTGLNCDGYDGENGFKANGSGMHAIRDAFRLSGHSEIARNVGEIGNVYIFFKKSEISDSEYTIF